MTKNTALHFFCAEFSLLLLVLFFPVTPALAQPETSQAINFAESLPVRDLPEKVAKGDNQEADPVEGVREINKTNREVTRKVDPNAPRTPDEALSSKISRKIRIPHVPNSPTVSFEGTSIADTIAIGQGFLPPDTNGAVGTNHYVQSVNVTFRVWDKAGNPLTPTAALSSLFAPLGGPCGSSDDGDPIVLYDQLADRWLISEFCTIADPNNHQLIAISKTGDPTGAYYLYDFMMPNNKFNDYPKFSLWPDAYYMTDNQFNQAGTIFRQAGVFAFNRAKMLAGDPTASFVYFDTAVLFPPGVGINGTDGIGGMLPACLDGLKPPPAGAPCPFAYFQANENAGEPADQLRIFDFHVDFTTPANSTFTERTGSPLPVAAFDPVTVPANSRNVIPQPPPAVSDSYVDAIADRLMFRLAYRNLGTSESLIANHTVNAATNPAYRAGIRWYQLTRATPTAAFTIAEQQTFAPADTESRWMGSGAINHLGDIAVGYSVSSTSIFPSIRYAARLHTDPAGSGLAQGEQNIIAGNGSQTHDSGRWGDYSDMTVDPSDDCSFWYTQEYYPVSSEPGNSTAPWHTRIAKFAPGPCSVSPRGTISGTITNCQTGLPANAFVQVSGGYSRATASNGTYNVTVSPGTYNATATGEGYDTASVNGLVVSNGGTATFNACLHGNLKRPVATSAKVTADSCNSNGKIDPNETVTVNLGIKNTGTLNTVNLVATLQATGGVTSPSGPQNYGVVVAGGGKISRPFTFIAANFLCGTPLVATLKLRDGATNLGTITYNLATGVVGAVNNYSSGNISVAIPDYDAIGVDIPINVADMMTLSDVNATFRINHPFDGALIISLVHPDSTVVTLVNLRGGSGNNFGTGANNCSGTPTVMDDQATTTIAAGAAPFAGSFKPDSSLSALNGKPSNGTWKLRISDQGAFDIGTVYCFKLELNKHIICCGIQIATVPPAVVTAENAFPANGTPDPGETLTVRLPLVNLGTTNTTNLVATLQATDGVTNPSGPKFYGVVVGGGASVARSFTFRANGNCRDNITLTLALQDGASNLGTVAYTMHLGVINTQTFSNTTAIRIPVAGNAGRASPYPSNIAISGLPTRVSKVTVKLMNIIHSQPDDVDVLLVSPTGRKFILMSDAIWGTFYNGPGQTYTFDDDAAATLPSSGPAPASGTFKPTNHEMGDAFQEPAPVGPYLTPATAGTDTLTSAFTGVAGGNPNGTWSLYVYDDSFTGTGSFDGGWQLSLTTQSACAAPVTAVSRKVHGGAGTFNINLPLAGNLGIECRTGGATNDYEMVVTFAGPVTVNGNPQAQVTSGAGQVGSGGVGNGGAVTVNGAVVTVPLTNVGNAQAIAVKLFNVNNGPQTGNLVIPMGVLVGDTTASASVNSSDIGQTKSQFGQALTATNFRADVMVNGTINSSDIGLVKSKSGTALP